MGLGAKCENPNVHVQMSKICLRPHFSRAEAGHLIKNKCPNWTFVHIH
jgi:hypothetical protein